MPGAPVHARWHMKISEGDVAMRGYGFYRKRVSIKNFDAEMFTKRML